MPSSSLLLGTLDVEVGATVTVTMSGGSGAAVVALNAQEFYLDDSSAARSFLQDLQAEIAAQNPDTPDVEVYIGEDRHIRIAFNTGANVSLTWSSTTLRDLLGFTGNLSGAITYTATNISPLLWMPGLTESTEARLGRAGIPVYDAQQGGGGSFTRPVTTYHNHRVRNTFEWNHVANSRVWTSSEAGGEYWSFWHNALLTGRQFALYRGVTDDTASSDRIVLSSGSRLGPYCWLIKSASVEFPYERATKNVEQRNNVKLPVVQVSELS